MIIYPKGDDIVVGDQYIICVTAKDSALKTAKELTYHDGKGKRTSIIFTGETTKWGTKGLADSGCVICYKSLDDEEKFSYYMGGLTLLIGGQDE